MKVLNKHELKEVEESLQHYFPHSQEAHGYVSLMNRVEVEPTDVLVDQWPDFNVLLVRPRLEQKSDFLKDICVFAKDKSWFRNILIKDEILDLKQFISLSTDMQHEKMLKAVAVEKGAQVEKICFCHLMRLQDPSSLTLDTFSFQVAPVQESHIALINSTWKFGMGEVTMPAIRSMVKNFPSYCVLDSGGQVVSWILTYASCAIGVLYTLPEYRQKGYAKALVSTVAKKLHSEGCPVYCFIEEENQVSKRLFKSLGFTEDPSYRSAWFEFNQVYKTL